MEAPESVAPPGVAAPGTGLKHTNKENVPELLAGVKAHGEQRRASLAPWAAPAQTPSKMAELQRRCARRAARSRGELSRRRAWSNGLLLCRRRGAGRDAVPRRAAPRARSHAAH
jgi:hypothetical protein